MKLRHGVLLFLALPVAAQARVSFKQCQERASIDSAQYPQRIDKDTTIAGVSCRQEKGRIIYVYDNKLNVPRSRIPKDAIKEQRIGIRSMLCTNPSLTALLKLVDMEYAYYDVENVFVGSIVVRIGDCR